MTNENCRSLMVDKKSLLRHEEGTQVIIIFILGAVIAALIYLWIDVTQTERNYTLDTDIASQTLEVKWGLEK